MLFRKSPKLIYLLILFALPSLSEREPFDSTYKPLPAQYILFKNANIYDGESNELQNSDLLIKDGIIQLLEMKWLIEDEQLLIVDATGKWITPGIIDIHSHMGVYPAPGVRTSSDGNESTSPVTADVWANILYGFEIPNMLWHQRWGNYISHFTRINLIGGRGVTVKNLQRNTIQSMKYPDAPHSLKMACGENPKRVYGNRGSIN